MKALTQYRRQEADFRREGITDRQKTTFDLSHDHKTTFSMGQLIPFCTLPTLPGDSWELGAEFMSRFAPLYLPIMHKVELLMTWFYVPNRILWKSPSGWEEFLTQEEELDIPYILHPTNPVETDPDNTIIRYRVMEYMGFPTRTEELIGAISKRVNVFPLAAYWAIYDQYFRNPQLQEEQFIPLVAGNNPDYETEDKLRVTYKLWNRDYLTMALPEPQMGEEIMVPMFNTEYDNDVTGIDPGEIRGPYRWYTYAAHNPSADGVLRISETDGGIAGATSNQAEAEPLYLNVQETAASIRQFRMAARLQEYLEQLMRSGQRYSDFMQSFFGENPDAGVIQVPQWIGGQKGNVVISEVLSTTETNTIPLGGYAGQMLSVDSTQKFRYYCKEHGWIIGILAVTPRTSYMNGLSRHYTRMTPLDYPWAHFEEIGDQAVKTKEGFLQMTDDAVEDEIVNETDFGYVPRYQEWKTQNDIVSGQMRTLWTSFHMARIFGVETGQQPFVLNSDFVSCYNPRISDVFQLAAAQDHEIYAHIWNHAIVKRQLKRYGIPKL